MSKRGSKNARKFPGGYVLDVGPHPLERMTIRVERKRKKIRKELRKNNKLKNTVSNSRRQPSMQLGATPALTKQQISKKKKNSTMNIKQKGTIISKSENGDYGFIDHSGGEKIFFHARQTLEHLDVDDRVLFETGDSKRQPDKLEAFYLRKAYPQPNGFDLALGKNLKATPEALDAVTELLEREIRLDTPSQEEIVITKELSDRTGHTLAVETTSDDEVFYAPRRGRKDYYRFVKNREPRKTNRFTVIINFVKDEEFYEVTTCYFGEKTPPAPWDRRATPDAIPFWQNHALIPHEIFAIDYGNVKLFDPDFFKSFEELQGKY